MKKKLIDVLEYVDFDDLMKMQSDLQQGGIHLHKLVKQQIDQEKRKHEQFCTICQGKMDQYSMNNFTLLFGPEDLKKRASFCALDCLEYFLVNLKDMKLTRCADAKED